MTPSSTPKAVEAKKLRLDLTPSQMGILLGLRLRAEIDAIPKMKAEMDELFSQVKPLEAPSSECAMKNRIVNIINGMAQIKKELAADLGNIGTPALSRTKKAIINITIRELSVLEANCLSMLNAKEEHER